MTRPAKINRAPVPVTVSLGTGAEGGDAVTPDVGDTWIWDGTAWVPGPAGESLPWYNVVGYGATGDGTTDDTTAVQDAIDACMTAGGGTVYFPPGIYQISGALQSTGTFNSQLVIPTASTEKAIRFLGWAPNRHYGGTPSVGNESVIRSDWAGTITGHPALFSAGTWHSIAQSTLAVTFQDLTIMCEDDPKLTALQLTAALSVRILNVQIRTESAVPSSAPTHATSVGLEGPWGLGSQVPDYALGLDIYGFYTGIVAAEQFHGMDVGIAFCGNAVKLIGGPGSPTLRHYPVLFDKLVYTWCQYGLVFETAVSWIQINLLAIEHDSSPFAQVYDIYDPSNYAVGFISYHALDFSGTIEDILVSGGANLSLFWGAGQKWKLNNVVDVPTGTNPSTNPTNGRRLYTDSTTGHLSARTSAGATIDYETDSSGVSGFATPAVVLSTAAAAGAATTVIRSDSTIVAFDATVPTTIAYSDTAATGSAAVAARRDHRHGMAAAEGSGVGPILIEDTPAGSPLIFADLLQNEEGNDLLYADTV